LDVVIRDPVLIVGLASRDRRTFGVGCHCSVSFLGRVGAFAALGDLALLGEVGDDPDGVEEVADSDCASEKEDI
jgi:hypothetical protein